MVKFLAGTKAREDYNLRFDITDKLSKSLTSNLRDLPDRVAKLSEENKQLQKQLNLLHEQLLPAKLESLAAAAVKAGKIKVVCQIIIDIDSKQLSKVAAESAQRINGVSALLFENRMVIAVSSKCHLDASEIVKQLAARLNLRGGGNKNVAQLGGLELVKFDDYRKVLLAVINEMP